MRHIDIPVFEEGRRGFSIKPRTPSPLVALAVTVLAASDARGQGASGNLIERRRPGFAADLTLLDLATGSLIAGGAD